MLSKVTIKLIIFEAPYLTYKLVISVEAKNNSLIIDQETGYNLAIIIANGQYLKAFVYVWLVFFLLYYLHHR